MARKRRRNLHLKPKIGVYCEGKSEEQYLKMLIQKYNAGNVHAQHIKVDSLGESGERLIIAAYKKGMYNKQSQIYVVFDRDDKNNHDLRKCQQVAKSHQVKILLSSICFEIWILMHFEPVMKSYQRDHLFDKLSGSKYFNQDYRNFKGSSYKQYLFDNVDKAMHNADELYAQNSNMISDNPYTNFHNGIRQLFPRKMY